jgi:hypothetical protein
VADKEFWGSFVWSALFGAEQMLWILLIGSLSGACAYTRVVVDVHVGDGSKCKDKQSGPTSERLGLVNPCRNFLKSLLLVHNLVYRCVTRSHRDGFKCEEKEREEEGLPGKLIDPIKM